MAAPSDPEAFFTTYLRQRFDAVREQTGNVTSVGCVTVRVVPGGKDAAASDAVEFSLRLRDGALEVTRGMDDDVMLQVTIPRDDFPILVSEAADRAQEAGVTRSAGAAPLGALSAKPETARLVRHVPGSVRFVVIDGDVRRQVLVTPGRRAATLDYAECTIECKMADLLDAEQKRQAPMQLFVSGKLKITGNIQIAMALASVFT